jgi:hypothetical protein
MQDENPYASEEIDGESPKRLTLGEIHDGIVWAIETSARAVFWAALAVVLVFMAAMALSS